MEYIPIRVSDLIRQLNRDLYLPAIQREFVWSTERIEKLFDSVMADFPIGSFLYWQVDQANKDQWPIYQFINDYDGEDPHNDPANMAGVTRDVTLVLDGQQRITSLFIGLRGSYRHFYYRWRKTRLYLNLLKPPTPNEDDPEELTYQFAFREDDRPSDEKAELWYRVGRILDFDTDAEDAKADMRDRLANLSDVDRDNANKLIGRLHNRIHTTLVGNYYRERSQDYDKVLEMFVRANSGGVPLEYSDLLLATATAKWEKLDARSEIHEFTDGLNEIGTGYRFGKDFVLKASLYLTDLPVQYKVRNFTRSNLRLIEANWDTIKEALSVTVRLMARFGFHAKNIVAPLGLLPIALFLMRRGNFDFELSSREEDAAAQTAIRKWFVIATLKNAFGGSSDTTLTRLRELLDKHDSGGAFPADVLYGSLGIEPTFTEAELDRLVSNSYQGRYTNLVLSLLYPNRDWKDAVFHEDHVFPKSLFTSRALKKLKFDDETIQTYLDAYNLVPNLQLLTEGENRQKSAQPFEQWIQTREEAFRRRHLIPDSADKGIDGFTEFVSDRTEMIKEALRKV